MRRAIRFAGLALAAVAVASAPVCGQGTPNVDDPIARTLFDPELIMTHRRAIGLTDQQRDQISKLIKDLQGQVVQLQWDLKERSEALATELARPRVDLDRAQDRLRQVLQTEARIKEVHLSTLVRIKNLLKPEQQEALQRLRAEAARPPDVGLASPPPA